MKKIIAFDLIVALLLVLFPVWMRAVPFCPIGMVKDDFYVHRADLFVSPVFSPPHSDAHPDWKLNIVLFCALVSVQFFLHDRAKQRVIAKHWQQKWADRSNGPDVLLRAATAPDQPAEILLRGAQPTSEGAPQQLLRASVGKVEMQR